MTVRTITTVAELDTITTTAEPMNGWDALSVTGAVLLIAAVALALVSFGTISERAGRRYARFAWGTFALACSCIIAAAWWAAA